MLDAVLFDLNDTLVDQSSAAASAVVAWGRSLRLPDPDEALVARWTSLSERHYSRYQRRELSFVEQRRARVRDLLALPLADDEADAAFGDYLVHYEGAWTTFPDALPTLERVRAHGLRVGVLTNGDAEHQALKLDLVGLTSAVDVLVASSTLSASKPDPRAFQEACYLLGSASARTLMVGNSLADDVLGATAAGLPAVLLDRGDAHRGVGVRRVTSLLDLDLSAPGLAD